MHASWRWVLHITRNWNIGLHWPAWIKHLCFCLCIIYCNACWIGEEKYPTLHASLQRWHWLLVSVMDGDISGQLPSYTPIWLDKVPICISWPLCCLPTRSRWTPPRRKRSPCEHSVAILGRTHYSSRPPYLHVDSGECPLPTLARPAPRWMFWQTESDITRNSIH